MLCRTSGKHRELVGYGTGTTFFEGAGPTATLTNTTAALRKDAGCTDNDVNSTDFATGAPAPRNSTVTGTPCVEVGPVVTVTISPAGATMFLGTPKQFTAVGTDLNGRTSPTTFTWSRTMGSSRAESPGSCCAPISTTDARSRRAAP